MKYHIGIIKNKKTANNKIAEALKVTTMTEDTNTIRLYRLLRNISLEKDHVEFDPLGLFGHENP